MALSPATPTSAIAHVLDRRKAKRAVEAGSGEVVLRDKALDDLEQSSD